MPDPLPGGAGSNAEPDDHASEGDPFVAFTERAGLADDEHYADL